MKVKPPQDRAHQGKHVLEPRDPEATARSGPLEQGFVQAFDLTIDIGHRLLNNLFGDGANRRQHIRAAGIGEVGPGGDDLLEVSECGHLQMAEVSDAGRVGAFYF